MPEPVNVEPVSEASLLEGLNPQQQSAVTSRARALLIVAGAGSGKTRVLTHRIAHLIATREAWPSQILAITFTNKAAAEMRERITGLLGDVAQGMWVSTFHSACVRILRAEAERFGYTNGFTIYDSADSRALLKQIIKELAADVYDITPASAAARISRYKNELLDHSDYVAQRQVTDPKEVRFGEVWRLYDERLRQARAFDFDDLIGQTVQLFRAFPEVAARYQRRFRWILVDEYQDTNHAQYALIRELTKPITAAVVRGMEQQSPASELLADGGLRGAALTVVGDSDQSIYAFRGADIRNIIEFERDFTDAQVVKLEQNYRSTQTILSAANAVIAENFDRQDKQLWTASGAGDKLVGFAGYSQHDEARFVADEIEALHAQGVPYSDIAVFYRVNAQTRALEEMLMRGAVPYRVLGGTKFYDRAEIKDMLAYLTSVVNPYDPLAWSRLLSSPKRGIGVKTEAQIAQYQDSMGLDFHAAMLAAADAGVSAKQAATLRALGEMLQGARASAFGDPEAGVEPAPVAEILVTVLQHTRYTELLRAKGNPQDEARAENVEEFLAQAREFDRVNPGAGLVQFLTDVSLVAAVDDLDDATGTVSLMTLHTAKGLEFPIVFLTGMEDGLLPHQMAFADGSAGLAEERRLMYVGITRARQKLYLSLAATRAQYGDVTAATPSRFLREIPAELIEWRQDISALTVGGGRGQLSGSGDRFSGGSRTRGFGGERGVRSADGGGQHGAAGVPGAGAATSSAMQAWRERKERAAKLRQSGGGFPNMVSADSVSQTAGLELRVGDRVRHDSYGTGEVVELAGSGAKQIAKIDFPGAGVKRFLVKLAPLTKVSE